MNKVQHVSSPNGRIVIEVGVQPNDTPNPKRSLRDRDSVCFTVRMDGVEQVQRSVLGLIFGGAAPLGTGLALTDVSSRSSDTTWQPVCGERTEARDHFNELSLDWDETIPPFRRMRIVLRAYDEGVAFRYELPEQEHLDAFVLTGELTEFHFVSGSLAYSEEYFEGPYHRVPAGEIDRCCERPLLVELANGQFGLVHEAGTNDYSRMMLKPGGQDTVAVSLSGEVKGHAPFATPWRVLMLGDQPGDLIENNDMIRNLNAPCELDDTAWIQPGTMIREYTLSTDGARELIDWAAPFGAAYILFDGGWYGRVSDDEAGVTPVCVYTKNQNLTEHLGLNIQEVVAYARGKGMGVWLYVNYGELERQAEAIFKQAVKWGVSGIKYGFVKVGAQSWTRWLHGLVESCAEHGLMVDIHDEYRPTGYDRTYPNLLTVEGIRGNEYCPTAGHNCILPFARFPAGHGDYTPAFFSPNNKNTYTHQLALGVIFFSPLQCLFWVGDQPHKHAPRPELEFWRNLPTVWDETRVLAGRVGEFIIMARRKDRTWYVGCITNETAREMTVSLDFLDPGTDYQADLYRDAPADEDPRGTVICESRKQRSTDAINVTLLASGGCGIKLTSLFI